MDASEFSGGLRSQWHPSQPHSIISRGRPECGAQVAPSRPRPKEMLMCSAIRGPRLPPDTRLEVERNTFGSLLHIILSRSCSLPSPTQNNASFINMWAKANATCVWRSSAPQPAISYTCTSPQADVAPSRPKHRDSLCI